MRQSASPSGGDTRGATEAIALVSLIHHAGAIPHDLNLEETARIFREQKVSFLALVRDACVSGICSSQKVGLLLGARFGFALHAQSPAYLAQVDAPLVYSIETPIRSVLAQALARHGEEFLEDVVVIDSEHHFVGLIPCEKLAHVQTKLVDEQVEELRAQNSAILKSTTALDQARGLWQALFDGSLLGVALCDERGHFKAMNTRSSQLLNLQGLAIEPRSLLSLLPNRSLRTLASILPDQRAGESRRCEQALLVPGKGERYFRLDVSWIDETQQYCICMDDITDRRALETRMKQQEKQQLFDTLVAGIAHELNNKMTPAIGFADLLTDMVEPGQSREFLTCIRNSMTEAAQIVKQLLQLSRPETAQFAKFDLRELAKDSLLMLQFQIKERGVRIVQRVPSESVHISGDQAMLKQVVMNLAINALHATEAIRDAELVLELSHGKAGPIFSVTDNGCGIPKELLGRIFDPFFTTKAPDHGTGLGLSVCLSIMRQHGGGITVRSEPGQGSTFSLCFPALREDEPRALATSPYEGKSSLGLGPAPASLRKLGRSLIRILAVDDEENVRALLHEILIRCFDCHIDMAVNGEDALRHAAAHNYELIISDVRMPEMDGLSFYKKLKDIKPSLCENFFLCSGYAGDTVLEDEIRNMGIPILRKPFSARELFELGSRRVGGRQ